MGPGKSFDFDFSSWSGLFPCHINVCFDEPLIDKKAQKLPLSPKVVQTKNPLPPDPKQEKQITSFFTKVRQPICILSELPENIKQNLENTLCVFSWPVYAEALCGLRESVKLQPFILKSGENLLYWLALNKKTDGVIRIGRRPCTRFWRDLEKKHPHLPILSVSDQAYSGLGRALPAVSFPAFFKWSRKFVVEKNEDQQNKEIFKEDQKHRRLLKQRLDRHPLSEPALVRRFSQKILDRSLLFLGNSLPIREWTLAAEYQPDKQLMCVGNRGANGIDGLVSTFFGMCQPHRENWCLLGDLSCLYDLSAPWVLSQLDPEIKCFLVIINNKGGQIFSSLFSDPIFLNSHSLRFKKWAEMWNLNYYCITQWPETLSFVSPAVIELQVNSSQTKRFYSAKFD